MAKHKVTALPAGPFDPSDIYYLLVDDRVQRWIVSNDGLSLKQESPMQTGDDISLLTNDSAFQTFSEVSALIAAATSPAISDNYADIAALLAAQGSQTENYIYIVVDATTDATVDLGWALYQKLTATTAALTDYRKLSEEESLDVVAGSTNPTTTLGDMMVHDGVNDIRLPVGTETWQLQIVGGVPTWVAPSGGVPFAHLTMLTVQNMGGANGTVRTANWGGTQLHIDPEFTHSITTNPSRITVVDTGRYSIYWNVGCTQTGGARTTLNSRILINGVTANALGRKHNYSRGSAYGDLSVGMTTEIELTAGDYIECQTIVDDTDATYTVNTVVTECEFIIRKIDALGGSVGATGATGGAGGAPTTVADAGIVVDLSNFLGFMYNQLAPNQSWWGTEFTFINQVENGWARVLIDTTGQVGFPNLFGGVATTGHAFAAGRIFEMFIEYIGGQARFSFIDLYSA
tara:strand:- start:88759 stop:90138 length:1380 start_codon:yes stop_codon:yes gene_type:complete